MIWVIALLAIAVAAQAVWLVALTKMIRQTHAVIDGPMWNDHERISILSAEIAKVDAIVQSHGKRIKVIETQMAKIVFVADTAVSWNDDEKGMN